MSTYSFKAMTEPHKVRQNSKETPSQYLKSRSAAQHSQSTPYGMPPTSPRDCSLNQNLISAHPTYRPGTHAQISAPRNTVGNLVPILNAKSSTHIHASPITSGFCTHTVTDMETNMARRLVTASRPAGTCPSASSYAVELWRQRNKNRNGYVHLSSYQLNRLPVRFTENTRARAESSRKEVRPKEN